MNIVKFLLHRVVLLAVVVLGMVACSGSDPAPGGGAAGALSGTAATGAAIANTQITIKGANNVTVAVNTDANGKYTRDVSTLTAPYLLRVSDPLNANSYLFSVANASGTANIHPFTDLIVRNWYKVKNSDVEAEFSGTLSAGNLPTVDGIKTIELVIKKILETSFVEAGVDSASFNLLTSQFDANNTGFDQVLDQTKVVIEADGVVKIQAIDIVIDPITGTPGAGGSGLTSILATTTIATDLAIAPAADTTNPTDPGIPFLVATNNSIHVTWAASTDAVGVVGYNIYKNGVLFDTSPFPSYRDNGLAPSTQYCYQIQAADAVPHLSAIVPVSATCATTLTVVDTTPPVAPTSLVATASTIQGQINLTWVASASTDTIAYDIYRGVVFITTTAGTSYNDTGLSASTPYSYTIKAKDAAGNASVASNSASATTATGIPSAPANVQAVAGNAQVTISWSPVSGATSYKMYMDTVSGISKTTVTPSVMHHPSVTSPFVHTALTNGTTYFFVITAVNASGESIESAQVQAIPTAPSAGLTLADIQAQFDVLNGLFATSLPVATDPTLAALFAPGFMNDGMNKDAFLIDITDPAFNSVGDTVTVQALVAPPRDSGAVANDATHQWFTYTCSGCNGFITNMLAIKDATSGKWLLAGNQRKVGVLAEVRAFRSTFNGTVNMDSFAFIDLSQMGADLITMGVSSVTVSGPGMVNSAGLAGPATLFDGTQTSFMFIGECSALVTTNCFNYANLAAGDYTFTVRGSFGGVSFTHTYVETLSGIPPATANLTPAMFPVINTTPTLASLVPGATVTANWTLPSGYTPQFSFVSAFNTLGFLFDVEGILGVTGSSFTLPPVFGNTGAVTNTSICVDAVSANGARFTTCDAVGTFSPPLPPSGSTTIPSMPFNGSVANGLGSLYTYTTVGNVGVINLTNLTDDVDVTVYTDATFTLPSSNWNCTSNISTVVDSCTAIPPVPSGTVLYIGVDNFTANGSATFMLNVVAPTP